MSLPWLRDRGPLSSRQRETGKCFCLLDFNVVHWWSGVGGGRAVGGRHRVKRTLELVSFWGEREQK